MCASTDRALLWSLHVTDEAVGDGNRLMSFAMQLALFKVSQLHCTAKLLNFYLVPASLSTSPCDSVLQHRGTHMTSNLICMIIAIEIVHALSSSHCGNIQALHPTIYMQLSQLFDGITQAHLDNAAHTLMQQPVGDPIIRPGSAQYDLAAAESLPPSSPDYPWSHATFIKITSLNGEFFVPGGHIPASADGYAFTHNW